MFEQLDSDPARDWRVLQGQAIEGGRDIDPLDTAETGFQALTPTDQIKDQGALQRVRGMFDQRAKPAGWRVTGFGAQIADPAAAGTGITGPFAVRAVFRATLEDIGESGA